MALRFLLRGQAGFVPVGLLLLAGCGQAQSDPGPGGVTVGEARALDQAAEMLDEQRLPQSETRTVPPSGTPAQPAAPE